MKKVLSIIYILLLVNVLFACNNENNEKENKIEMINNPEVINDFKANLPEGITLPKENRVNYDVTYKTVGDISLKMRIQMPSEIKYEKNPVLFLITGGGFQEGDRFNMINFFSSELGLIKSDGFMVCSIDYRLRGDNVSMSQIVSDCMDGLRYLNVFAEELGIDVDKITVCGHSAGGYLVLATATLDQSLFYHDSPYKDIKYKLNGCAALAPIVSMHDIEKEVFLFDQVCKSSMNTILGLEKLDFDIENLCPYDQLSKNICNTIIIHGTSDPLVNYKASVLFADKANTLNANVKLVTSEHGKHCFESDGTTPSMSLTDVCAYVHSFLNEQYQ